MFFQAEDGIRDKLVTGVQTCALPIYQTPHAFIRNTRLQYAEKLLTHSNKTITDIMFSCGFSNPASFSTMFKNFYGSSPRDYMQAHRKI